jgi:APA family basic amino acid/polyamine antiporter
MKQVGDLAVSSVPHFGFWTATALVIGNMIGAGIFFLPASLAAFGPISLASWLITATGALCLAYVFARLSFVFPKSGGPYTHSRSAFGDFVGFMMGWGYWTMTWTSNAAISLTFVSYLHLFLPQIQENSGIEFLVALLILWGTTLINCLGVTIGGIVQVITAVIKVSPLILVGLVGIFYIHPSNYFPLNVSGSSGGDAINAAAALTLWAFIGLEAATVPADSVDNPGKTISRATLFGTTLAAVVYCLITVVLFGVVPASQLAQSKAPFAEAASMIFGPWVVPVIGVCILISVYGGLNGWVLLQGQIPEAMAKEGLFPKLFAKVTKNNTPVFGLIFSSILVSILLIFNMNSCLIEIFKLVVLVGVVMTLIAYLASALSVFSLIKPVSFGLKIAVLGGAAYSIWAIIGAGSYVITLCLMGYIAGIPIYWWTKHDHG